VIAVYRKIKTRGDRMDEDQQSNIAWNYRSTGKRERGRHEEAGGIILRPPEVLNEGRDKTDRPIATTKYLYRIRFSRLASVFDITIPLFWFTVHKALM
jgi:hypothetical protein